LSDLAAASAWAGIAPARSRPGVFFGAVLLAYLAFGARGASAEDLFQKGVAAYRGADYALAARIFRESAASQPASGTLLNLGNAEWQSRRTGAAVQAWEQTLWLEPFDALARGNLQFARKNAQLEAPDLVWYEVVSSWLPVSWWAWLTGVSLWLAIGMTTLPGILRRPKAVWHQAVAALGLMIFLLSVPAHIGVHTRSRIGFVLHKDTPLRLTPTTEAQSLIRLPSGEAARCEKTHGNFVLIRTNHSSGWVEQSQLGLICPKSGAVL